MKDEKTKKQKGKKASEEKLEQLQKERDELFEKLQRLGADYANFQKRVPRQISDTLNYEKETIFKGLLPVLDNFEHTLKNAGSSKNLKVLAEAVRIIYEQMLDILKSYSVEQIKAVDQNFDPSMHQAVTQKTDPCREEDIVLEQFQTGYKLNGRVIRPAKVMVNKLSPVQSETQQDSRHQPEQKDTEKQDQQQE